MLEFTPGRIWIQGAPLRFHGLAFGTRMTVIRLADGALFLHSPTPLDAGTRRALDALGPVRHVVSPNKLHHLSLEQIGVDPNRLRRSGQPRESALPYI